MSASAAPEVERFGSGLLCTEVAAEPGNGWTWRRTVGPLAPHPFAEPSSTALAAAEQAARCDPVGIVTGGGGVVRAYRAPGPESVAGLLLDGALDDPAQQEHLVTLLRGLGRCLRVLHAAPADAVRPAITPTRGLRRLGDWLEGRATSSTGLHAAGRVRDLLGADRWDSLGTWHLAVATDPDRVLVHGAPGLGSVAPDAGLTTAALLTGEDLALAPWYTDVGWVLGELAEFGAFHGGADSAAWSRLAAALGEGYGRALGRECSVVAALRITLHLHDFLCYVGWSDGECVRYAELLRVVVDACADAPAAAGAL